MRLGVLAISVAATITSVAAAPAVPQSATTCQPAGSVMRLAGLPEASGLAASQTSPGRLWAHNDSGKPEIFSLDAKGKVTGRVAVTGAKVEDWEAIAIGRCGTGSCLFIADIGDNSAKRRDITIYQIEEPAEGAASAKVDAVLRASYPDGAHDAEALLVGPDGTLYVVTKGETGPAALYRMPRDAKAGATVRLERVGSALEKGKMAEAERITDGAISPDGELVVLRTLDSLAFYRAAEFLQGDFKQLRRTDLRPLREPQGEGVAFGSNGTIYVAGESGGTSRSGTLAVLTCPK
jgi:hypothetical protein